jgi:BirA family biotin operon repressor/biotin-[acetyl-CoA-carboxylase] ligase
MNQNALRPLLSRLSDGQFHSGESLGQDLLVSRAAIWKRIRQLQQIGIPVEVRKGLGYRLPAAVSLLEESEIRESLAPETGRQLGLIQVQFVTDSTNDEAMRYLGQGETFPLVVLAEQQLAGRGRRGRQWHSPFGGNIYFSLGWESTQSLAALEGLSLVVGLKVAEVLESTGIKGLQLKWPNDVLWQGKKLAGVLIDVQGDPQGPVRVVIGIGLNVQMPQREGACIDQHWVDCAGILGIQGLGIPSRNHLVAQLIEALLPALKDIEKKGFVVFQREWQKRDMLMGQSLFVQGGVENMAGYGKGVDEHGAYILETTAGHKHISGGEISLRMESASQ